MFRFCVKWKLLGRCFEEKYKYFMNTNCKKTCGICTGLTTVRTTTPNATTKFPTATQNYGYKLVYCKDTKLPWLVLVFILLYFL